MSDEDASRKPSFSGNRMPLNINPIGLDHSTDETTRRIAFQPSFEPVSSFNPPCMGDTKLVVSSKSQGHSTRDGTLTPPSASKGIWKIKSVPTLPEYHPLERTAVFVPNASSSDVSMRISDVLRERSIESFYEDEKAKAKCLTTEGVDFRVRLYRGRGRFDHGIIVEVQRRFGASNTFYKDTMAILDAAQGKVPPPPSQSGSTLPLVSDVEDDFEPVDGSSSLLMVSKMLSHPGYDSHYLALQTLSSLTDASKMGAATARTVSTDLLRLDTDNEVGTKVLSLIIDKQGDDDTFKLRCIAVQVIANAFQSVNGKIPSMLKDQLRSVLIKELRQAEKNPRIAVQAARILEFFVPEDTGSDLHNALETALEVGASRYASLERQAQVCLDKLA